MKVSAAVALAMSVTLTGCSSSSKSSSTTTSGGSNNKLQASYNPQPASNLKDGGTLTTATVELSPQFNVWQQNMTAYTSAFWNWYNPVLSQYSPDGNTITWDKNYITDVKQSESGGNTVVTYTINPKAVYNDGTPIDWKAFENTWKANNGSNSAYLPNASDGYDRIKSVAQGSNSKQVVVTFNGKFAWWKMVFPTLLNPKVNTPALYNNAYVNNPHPEWGAGPYTVDKVDLKGGTISFKRNPKWWGTPGHLTERTFIVMEPSASINAFKNGQIDATSVGTKDRLAQIKGMSGIDIRRGSSTSNDLLNLNAKSPLLSDIQVRKAVMEGIDREQLDKINFQGLGYSEPLPGSFLLFPFQKGYENNFPLQFNTSQAKKDLEADGWKMGSDGYYAKGGKQLKLTYVNLGDSPIGKADAIATQAMMKAIGVNLVINQRPDTDFSKVVQTRAFDIFPEGFSQSDPFGAAYACQLYCSDSGLNISGTAQKSTDSQFKALANIGDPDQQIAAANKLEKQALQQYGIMPTENGPTIVAVKKGLANYGASVNFVAFPEDIGWQK